MLFVIPVFGSFVFNIVVLSCCTSAYASFFRGREYQKLINKAFFFLADVSSSVIFSVIFFSNTTLSMYSAFSFFQFYVAASCASRADLGLLTKHFLYASNND